jgi:hypothetical protein
MSRADHRKQATCAREIERREILGRAHRVVQRQDQRGETDPELLGSAGHRRGGDDRRREIAVRRAVMLAETYRIEARGASDHAVCSSIAA